MGGIPNRDTAVIIWRYCVPMITIARTIIAGLLLMPTTVMLPSAAADTRLHSGDQQVLLLELYTSEGCSSCPPADRWLSRLKEDERLWTHIVPVAFHVDYWNRLGWKDRFSEAAWSKRQYDYAAAGLARSVYTPGFFANGQEWRGWFRDRALPGPTNPAPGRLALEIGNGSITASYESVQALSGGLILHLALLGMNQSTQVRSGENQGRRLEHDFVVLELLSRPAAASDKPLQWRLPVSGLHRAEAIAAWVTTADSPRPLQAVGGWLPPTPAP